MFQGDITKGLYYEPSYVRTKISRRRIDMRGYAAFSNRHLQRASALSFNINLIYNASFCALNKGTNQERPMMIPIYAAKGI